MKDEIFSEETGNTYKIVSYIAGGSFGSVWLAHLRGNPDDKYAIKMVPHSLDTNVKNEINIMIKLSASGSCIDRIVCIYDFIEDTENKNTYIVMEYIKGEKLNRINEDIMYDCLIALCYMHYENILHRDIKPANILITREDQIKLVDLGLGCIITQRDVEDIQTCSEHILEGSLGYIDPLLYQRTISRSCKSSDIYALGATFYTILTGELPPMYSMNYTKKDIQEKYRNVVLNLDRLSCSTRIKSLVMKMMDPCGDRPTCTDCINYIDGSDQLLSGCSDNECINNGCLNDECIGYVEKMFE